MQIDRRAFLATSAVYGLAATAAGAVKPTIRNKIAWYDVQKWGVEGKGWNDTKRYFDRLPGRAESKVRGAVWGLSRHSAGMLFRFKTNSPVLHADYSLFSSRLAMPHMPATGVSGLDVYARDEKGTDRWLTVSFPRSQKMTMRLAGGIDSLPGKRPRTFTIYLPLYNGVETLQIGVQPGSVFEPIKPRKQKPIVFYGTSIMHGACASRAGLSISGILGRRLNRPVINLGFSGNGTMELSVGKFLAELDPAVYAIDCLPNMRGETVAKRTVPLVNQLRKARPKVPILLVEDRTYAYARFRRSARKRHAQSRAALRTAYKNLKAAGVKNLHYLSGASLLGSDGEATTDGSHPNDLGMVRYADAYEPILKKLL